MIQVVILFAMIKIILIINLQQNKSNRDGSNLSQGFIDTVNQEPITVLDDLIQNYVLETNRRYVLDNPGNDKVFVLPAPIVGVFNAIQLQLSIGEALPVINLGTVRHYENLLFEGMRENSNYDIEWIYDPNAGAWFYSIVRKIEL